jgi:hypothetical protein
MGFWSDADKVLRDARHELDEQCDNDHTTGHEKRNEKLQSKVVEAGRDASKVARGFWG